MLTQRRRRSNPPSCRTGYADAISKLLSDAVGVNRTINLLVEGFKGLGLIVEVAALGVISARAVVERRQQIGVLRAIGHQRRMVQLSFLLECSFIEDGMSSTTPYVSVMRYVMPSLEHATVAQAMHPGVISCEASATLREVARMMAGRHVHCIAVMGLSQDEHSERLVWGVISDLDLVRVGVRKGTDELAGALAEQPIITVEPSMPLRQAAEVMLARGVSHLLVVEPELQRPVGILSTFDIAGVLAWGEA
jgi:CBS domain-containing protein